MPKHLKRAQHWTYCGRRITWLRADDESVATPQERNEAFKAMILRGADAAVEKHDICPRCIKRWKEDPQRGR